MDSASHLSISSVVASGGFQEADQICRSKNNHRLCRRRILAGLFERSLQDQLQNSPGPMQAHGTHGQERIDYEGSVQKVHGPLQALLESEIEV